mmetsp:Transcript_98143/g.219912  ORF Transcript_98143/g.219912 Transcript_98143/m.219912 type:complete len:730 (-) Transcript_98143:141-2330(-)
MLRRAAVSVTVLLAAQPVGAGNSSSLVHEDAAAAKHIAEARDAERRGLKGGLLGNLLHPAKKANDKGGKKAEKKAAPEHKGGKKEEHKGGKKEDKTASTRTSSGASPASVLQVYGSVVGTEAAASIKTAEGRFSIDMARAFSALCKLAYCGPGPVPLAPYGLESKVGHVVEVNCGPWCTNAGFELRSVHAVAAPEHGQANADFAYIASVAGVQGKPAPFKCVVVFRGTFVNPANMKTNKDNDLVPFVTPSCPEEAGCKVAQGTYMTYQHMKPDIMKSLHQLGCTKGSEVAVTGHSLGGQLATIATFDLEDNEELKIPKDNYVWEPSIAFNKKAVEKFEQKIGKDGVSIFWMTNRNDAVTMYPKATKEKDYTSPGFQVWLTNSVDEREYVLCGNALDSPNCGVLSMKRSELCNMNKGTNPEELDCGPNGAPYDGPHCEIPMAPAGNICSFSGSNKGMYIGAAVQTCMTGIAMAPEAPAPQEAPQVFPPPGAGQELEAPPAPTPAPTPPPVDLHQDSSRSYKKMQNTYEDKGKKMPEHVPCFKENTAVSPPGLLGHYLEKVSDIYACQERCEKTKFCEMFMYYHPQGANGQDGNCEVCGGWGEYVPHIIGVTSGPADCAVRVPELDAREQFNLNGEYMRFMASQYDAHYAIEGVSGAFEKHIGGLESFPTAPQYSMAQMVCFGCAMLSLGACLTLIVARTGRLANLMGIRPVAGQLRPWAVDEAGFINPEE